MWKQPLTAFMICCVLALSAQEETTDSKGIKYQHIVKETPLSIHVIELDPSRYRLTLVRALNDGLGRETVLSMSKRSGAAGAINGGYYRTSGTFDGLPQGVLKIGEDWFSWPEKNRACIGWTRDGKTVLIDRLSVDWKLTIGGKEYPIDGLNVPRTDDIAVLYTWPFHRTTLSMPGGTELLIHRGQIIDIHRGLGDSSIPNSGYVYSIGSDVDDGTQNFRRGTPVKLTKQIVPLDSQNAVKTSQWQRLDYIVGGAPILVKEGKINTDFKNEQVQETFLTMRYPRTAMGLKEDGTIVCVVVDGRQISVSRGMTIPELAEFMLSLGCKEALNLDGGQSSILVWNDTVKSSPVADKEEKIDEGSLKRVSDAILFFPMRELQN